MIEAAACLVLAVAFKLDVIAFIGSAVALLISTFITAAHFQVRAETGASVCILAIAIARGLGQGQNSHPMSVSAAKPGDERALAQGPAGLMDVRIGGTGHGGTNRRCGPAGHGGPELVRALA